MFSKHIETSISISHDTLKHIAVIGVSGAKTVLCYTQRLCDKTELVSSVVVLTFLVPLLKYCENFGKFIGVL